jgi:hypothetical protein
MGEKFLSSSVLSFLQNVENPKKKILYRLYLFMFIMTEI